MSLLIVCPSRGRPAGLGRLLDRLDETCTTDWTLAAGLDTDDPAKTDYMRLLRPGPRGAQARDHTNVLIAARRPLGGWINTLWQMFAHSGVTHVAFLGDDHLPAERGWDADLIAAVDDCPAGVGIAYGDDLLQGEALPTAPVMSANIPAALGWLSLPGLQHYYCVTPDTPVLTAGLRWVPAGKVAAGDDLVGVDEYPPRRGASRAYRRTSVRATALRRAALIRLVTSDGETVTSADHRWLAAQRWQGTGQPSPGRYEWREAARFRPGDQVAAPLRVWPDESSFDAGWLSGLFDGEGTCGRYGQPYPMASLSVAQNPGPVLDRAEAILASMGITYRRARRHAARDDCIRLEITPRTAAVELLGRLQPARLDASRLWQDMPMQSRQRRLVTVEAVEPAGAGEVASIQTMTGTFLAAGMVAHNCDNVWADLGRACECLRYVPEVTVEHLHHAAGKAEPDATYADAWQDGRRMNEDREAFLGWRQMGLPADATAVRALIPA